MKLLTFSYKKVEAFYDSLFFRGSISEVSGYSITATMSSTKIFYFENSNIKLVHKHIIFLQVFSKTYLPEHFIILLEV